MRYKPQLRLSLPLAVLAILGLLALACGGDDEDTATSTPAGGGTVTGTPTGALKLGSAGIASKPRPVRGLDSWSKLTESLDDGLAVFKTRPSGENRTGISQSTIKLGQSSLITGPASDVEACWGPVHQGILKRINEAGGIHGRQIQFIKYDDALNPALTVQNIRRLVEQDQIFATYFSENTVGHQATREYLQERRILELFPTDNDLQALEPPWPYYTGVIFAAPFVGAGVYADYIKQNLPNAKVAVITSDSAFSQNDREVFKAQAQKQGLNIVADVVVPQAQVDPTSQVQQAVTAGADTLVSNLLPVAGANALGALRQTIGNSTMQTLKFGTPGSPDLSSRYNGDINAVTVKSPATDPALPLWAQLERLATEENARWCGTRSVQAVHVTEMLVRVLEAAGPDPTREGVLEALQYAFDGYNCTVCIGPLKLNYTDTQAAEAFQFARWDTAQNRLISVGQPISYETTDGKGVRGTDPKYTCDVPANIKALNLPNYPSTLCPWRR